MSFIFKKETVTQRLIYNWRKWCSSSERAVMVDGSGFGRLKGKSIVERLNPLVGVSPISNGDEAIGIRGSELVSYRLF